MPKKLTNKKEEASTSTPTALGLYHAFMKKERSKVQAANPSFNYKRVAKVASKNWVTSSENLKNKN
ncbi:hypothetical protein K501DRAFT_170316 [Backusella circina FSU 941]|nr:hypothetical protein K501DRAFT_170316 [Backusella circina FSU 941]